MSTETLDCRGLRCPQPILKIAAKAAGMKPGDILEVLGDCSTFEADARTWCSRTGRTLLSVTPEGSAQKAQIRF